MIDVSNFISIIKNNPVLMDLIDVIKNRSALEPDSEFLDKIKNIPNIKTPLLAGSPTSQTVVGIIIDDKFLDIEASADYNYTYRSYNAEVSLKYQANNFVLYFLISSVPFRGACYIYCQVYDYTIKNSATGLVYECSVLPIHSPHIREQYNIPQKDIKEFNPCSEEEELDLINEFLMNSTLNSNEYQKILPYIEPERTVLYTRLAVHTAKLLLQ